MVRLILGALACALLIGAAACGAATLDTTRGGSAAGGNGKGKGTPKLLECIVTADVTEVGVPSQVRFTAQPVDPTIEVVSWSWGYNNYRIDSGSDGKTVFLPFDKQGDYQVTARGIDANGNTCTGHIRIRARRTTNAAPVVTDFGGPQLEGTHTDDSGRTFERWVWVDPAAYDPEGDVIMDWEWGVYAGSDGDGDGFGDELLAFKRFFSGHSFVPDQLQVEPSSDPYGLYLQVNQRSGVVDREARVTLTLTDAQGASRKWGDGHVTLMK